jgi:hypothetical protein
MAFVRGLSADAVGEIERLPIGARACALNELRSTLKHPDPWYQFNLARQHARVVIANVRYGDYCHPYSS